MGTPSIPPDVLIGKFAEDLANADPLAKATAKKVADLAAQLGATKAGGANIGAWGGGIVHMVLSAVSAVIGLLVQLTLPLLLFFLRVLTKFRTESMSEVTAISAAVLSEFLGTEITADAIKPGRSPDESIDGARVIGTALHARLIKEFAPEGVVTPQTGELAARIFSGYAVNFGVQNAMIGTAADALSVHFLEQFRDLGVDVARNLGLGRLQRQALGPLIRNLIAEPYDRALRKRYRPDILSPRELVIAYYAGRRSRDDVMETLAKHGYKDEDIEELLQQIPPDLNQTEIVRLMRYGEMTQDEVVAMLRSMGWPEDVARKRIRAALLARVDDNWQAYVSLLQRQRIDGVLEEEEFNKLLDRAPFTDDEKQLVRDYVGQSLEVPRAHLSWTEVKAAFEEGVIDMDYVDRWLEREGFSDEDALTREYMLLLDLDRKTEKAQVAAEKAARKAAASGQPPPAS